MSTLQPRIYDLLVLGTVGYTGKLCVKYMHANLPTALKWAIAGRSEKELLAV